MNLDSLFKQHGTDKSSLHHNYSPYYERHFSSFKDKQITMLIAGVGGYEYPDRGGGDLRAFNDYFINGKIVGFDIHDKSGLKFPKRVSVYKGSENDAVFLNDLISKIGQPDIIINDASHMNRLCIESFTILFPHLKKGGIYVIEDLESSWWNSHGFDGQPDYKDMTFKSSINFLRTLINDVNAKHLPNDPSFLPIESIHFYQNICFIHKK